MKSDYRVRATKFLRSLWRYLREVNIMDTDEVQWAVDKYMADHPSRRISVCSGSARVAIITSDYVIKWDYDEENVEEIGGCEAERGIYLNAKRAGFGYLFAETTSLEYEGYDFVIMPKIPNVQKHKDSIKNHLSYYENEYIKSIHLIDLHSYNWGMKNNKPVIIDYAYINNYETESE